MSVTYDQLRMAESQINTLQVTVTSFQIKVLKIQGDIDVMEAAKAAGLPESAWSNLPNAYTALAKAQTNLDSANTNLAAQQAIVDEYNNQPAPTTSAGTSASGNPPAPAKELKGSADGDKGVPGALPTTVAGAAVAAAGATVAGATAAGAPASVAGATASGSTNKLPGYDPTLLSNPLSSFSSYTYQISLYMVSPDAYNMYSKSGKDRIFATGPGGDLGVCLVAQSGGSTGTGADKRAPGFELDYYIDDLKFESLVTAGVTQTQSNISHITFNVIEPYGFSFITKLAEAGKKLLAGSTLKGYGESENPTRQFFLLGVRFQGYDKNGKVVVNGDAFSGNKASVNERGVYERIFDITIYSMKYKIDGRITTYNIEAKSTPIAAGHTTKRGRLNNDVRIIASTVSDALGGVIDNAGKPVPPSSPGIIGLLDILNANQQELYNDKDIIIPNVYKLRFMDVGDGMPSPIGSASIKSPTSTDKTRSRPSEAKKTTDSTVGTAVNSYPMLGIVDMTFKNDNSIMQAIGMIISQSTYLEKAMKKITKDAPAVNSSGEDGDLVNGGTSMLRYYNLSTEVTVLGWDTKVRDWAYEITYVIQPYDTPSITSTYGNNPRKYYGPFKRYEYWYTGLNSEIIQYEQVLNNNWINLIAALDNAPNSIDIARTPNLPDTGNKQGKQPGGLTAENTYITNLMDPANWAMAKIKVLGDPDFLISNRPGAIGAYNQFYYDDNSINANGGQVFIEINFNEGVDYDNKSGQMSLNKNIKFWKYPDYVEKAIASRGGGISYMVRKVSSTFSKGSFTQEIYCNLSEFPADPVSTASSGTPASDAGRASPDNSNVTAETAGRTGVDLSPAAAAAARADFAAIDRRRTDLTVPALDTARATFAATDPRRVDLSRPIIDAQGVFTNATQPGVATSSAPPAYVVASDDAQPSSSASPSLAGREPVPTLQQMMANVTPLLNANTLLPKR